MSNDNLVNLDAEKAVIGALMSDGRTYKYIRQLTGEEFTDINYRVIFKRIRELVDDKGKFDLVMLDQKLNDPTILDVALTAMSDTPTGIFTEQHVQTLKEYEVRRRVSDLCIKLYKDAGNPINDIQGVVMDARKTLQGMSAGRVNAWVTMSDILKMTLADLEKRERGEATPLKSGLTDLDNILSGFFPGELTVIGARPGAGKSSIAMAITLDAAFAGKNVAFCSLEMAPVQFGQRILSNRSGVNGMKMRRADMDAEDWSAVVNTLSELANLKTGFAFTVNTIEDLEGAVQEFNDNEKIDILVLDYIQLMDSKRKHESERLKVGYISWSLKQMAMSLGIPVIALSQLKRPEGGDTGMPTMKDLRESGNIEADADGIILMHQPRRKEEKTVHPDDRDGFEVWAEQGLKYTVVKVEKQRMGQTGITSVLFDGAHMKYIGIGRGQ